MTEYVDVVYNSCYGGFSLSKKAEALYEQLSGRKYSCDTSRTDPCLVQVVVALGRDADGTCSNLKIESIRKGTLYRIDEYDGLETVATMDTYNWEVA